jgi:hypothetical protein
VLEILGAMARWDDHERALAIAIFKGRNVVREDGVPREDAERILNETLKALPHYLSAAEIAAYTRDRAKFVKENAARASSMRSSASRACASRCSTRTS